MRRDWPIGRLARKHAKAGRPGRRRGMRRMWRTRRTRPAPRFARTCHTELFEAFIWSTDAAGARRGEQLREARRSHAKPTIRRARPAAASRQPLPLPLLLRPPSFDTLIWPCRAPKLFPGAADVAAGDPSPLPEQSEQSGSTRSIQRRRDNNGCLCAACTVPAPPPPPIRGHHLSLLTNQRPGLPPGQRAQADGSRKPWLAWRQALRSGACLFGVAVAPAHLSNHGAARRSPRRLFYLRASEAGSRHRYQRGGAGSASRSGLAVTDSITKHSATPSSRPGTGLAPRGLGGPVSVSKR